MLQLLCKCYAECHNAESCCAECRILSVFMLSLFMLSVAECSNCVNVMLSVVMLNVAAV